ncbi:DUF1592 domain-containing protein [Stratiformator vulcanicus]|nr:DUF1592 domain-containing protein [Stratiformator vulcanicus]
MAGLVYSFSELNAAESPVGHEFLANHCMYCHEGEDAEAGLNLEALKFDSADPQSLDAWTRIHDRVVSGEMPPAAEERPDPHDIKQFSELTDNALHDAWRDRYTTHGRVGGRRLNPLEYEVTLRDLLKAPWLQLKEMLPPDPESHGFDNVADVQEVSYVQLARYLEAAEVAIDGAMRLRPAPEPTTVRTWFSEEGRYLGKGWKKIYKSIDDRPEWTFFVGQPNNAQAPRRIRNKSQQIPGWYRFRVRCRAALVDRSGEEEKLLPPTEGQVAWINTAAKRVLGKFDVPEGPEGGIVEFTAWQYEGEPLEFFCATMNDSKWNKDVPRHGIAVDWFEIEGPFADESCDRDVKKQPWPSESYQQLFGDLPMTPWTQRSRFRPPQPLNRPDLTANKRGLRETFQLPPKMMMVESRRPAADAERLLRQFMYRAYRRPPEESEVKRCLAFAIEGIKNKLCFQDAMRTAYKAVLCSPDFLYFQEAPGRLDDYALATRLSYLLWRTTPDESLLEAARTEGLQRDAVLMREFSRLLADPRAGRFFGDFAGQWLELRKIHDTSPDKDLFPEYFCDNHLVDSAVDETVATFGVMVRDNLPAKTVVDADFVMVNERLAKLYDIEGVEGRELQRVSLPSDSPRGGFLTQSSILKITANGLTTSPVLRGAWVQDRILGTPPAPPPPGAGAIEPDTRGATTIRDLLAKHSRFESCAACHAKIDPPGFALENFDVMGAWRENYRSLGMGTTAKIPPNERRGKYKIGLPVDASGVTYEGSSFKDIHEFRDYLLSREEQLARNLTERLMTFATGARPTFADRLEIESILQKTASDGYPVQTILRDIVLSEAFRSK